MQQNDLTMKQDDNTFSVARAEDSPGFLLWQVTTLWQREIKKALAPYNLTHSQFVLLASTHWLLLHGSEVTQIVLSQHTGIDPMTTSTVLRNLQSKGLIRRREHDTDTRAKSVDITAEGRELAKKAVVAVENFDRAFFAVHRGGLPAFNESLRALLKLPV